MKAKKVSITQSKSDAVVYGFIRYVYAQPFFARLKFCYRVMMRKYAKVKTVQK